MPPSHPLAATATSFKALHIPGDPLLLANVYDATSARIVASLPQTRALASASYAVALAGGTTDPNLDLDTHLSLLAPIAAVAKQTGKPLTVDLQDGYGNRLEEAIKAVIDLGAVGVNIEDSEHQTERLIDVEVAVDRIKHALAVAKGEGVADFVVNARSDSFFKGGTLDESIERGKRYLEAGATTVYILWPVERGMLEEEVARVVKELGGRVNLATRVVGHEGEKVPGNISAQDLARLGVARVSVGPRLYFAAAKALKDTAAAIYGSGV